MTISVSEEMQVRGVSSADEPDMAAGLRVDRTAGHNPMPSVQRCGPWPPHLPLLLLPASACAALWWSEG